MGVLATFAMPFWMVLASMMGFGSMARDAGLDVGIALGSTLGVWGLPGQVAMTELYTIGAPLIAILAASSMANLRFMPMAVVMIPLFNGDDRARRWRYALAQMMSVNIWTVTMHRAPGLILMDRLPFYLGVALTAISGGVIGTVLGYVLAGTMPFFVVVSLVFLNPAYFVFVFSSVRQRNCVFAVVIGAVMGPVMHLISPDWGVVVTGVLAGTAAFYLDRSMGGSSGPA